MTLTLNKIAAGFVGVAMVAGLAFALAAERAHAVSLSELVELFIALEIIPADKAAEAQAAIDGMGGDAAAPAAAATMSCNFTRNLTTGDTGADVMDLQKLLNAKGFMVSAAGAGSPGMETQYYGPATAAAVAAMQTAFASEILAPLGLTTGTGYFGASTRAKANALCAVAPTTPEVPEVPEVPADEDEDMTDEEDDTTLSGGEASIGGFKRSTTPSSVEVAEGDEEVDVAGFEFDVDDADASLRRAYVSFEETSSADNSVDPWDYFDSVQLYVNGELADEMNAGDEDDWEDISSSNRYELRFTGLDEFLAADEKAKVTVGVTMLNNVDGADEDAEWTVSLRDNALRLRDGAGIDSYTGDSAVSRMFSLETAGQGEELKIRTDSSNPDSSVIKVDDTDTTDDVTVLVFTLEAKDADMEIREIPVVITTSDNNVDDVVADIKFVVDGEVMGDVSSAGIATTTTFEFDNNEFIIDEGDKVTVEIVVDLKDTSDYDAGTTLEIDITSTERDLIDAEGTETLLTGDMTGTADGETHQLLAEGVFAEIVSVDDSLTNEDTAAADKAVFKIKFDVTAFEDDFYVPFGAVYTAASADTTGGANYRIETDSGAAATLGTSTIVAGLTNTSGATVSGSFWKVADGETETFELSVTFNPAANGTYRGQLMFVNYAANTTGAATSTHSAAPAEDFETGSVQITDNEF